MKILTCFFLVIFLFSCKLFAQIDYNFFISNSGKNSNPGTTEQLPKQTIAATIDTLKKFSSANGSGSIGLKSDNVFNESFKPFYSIRVGAYNESLSKNNFAVMNGSDVFDSGWKKTIGTLNTFNQLITYSGFGGPGINIIGGYRGYSYINVIEIDKELEKIAPFTARKVLRFASSLQAVDSIPGSFYEPPTTPQNPIIVSIHTSNGSSPNDNPKYRYEITVRDWAVNAYFVKNNVFENLWVRGYGAGIGALPSDENSYYNKIIFGPGAGIHQVVTHNAIFNNSLFLPGAKNTNEYALVFYDFEGLLRNNKISNSIFLDIKTPIYTHTHGTATNYATLELNNVSAFADSSEGGNFISTASTDTVMMNNVYTADYTSGFSGSSATYVSIQNSYFKDVSRGIFLSQYGANAIINNIFIKTNGNKNDVGISLQSNSILKLTNSIIHIRNYRFSNNEKTSIFIDGLGKTSNKISAIGNIFICDINPSKTATAATTNTDNGLGTSPDLWSNNVYILLNGKISWIVTNENTNSGSKTVQTFNEWKKQSGQDKNSLFFDLRNDSRGLKAIFIDPDNGNYELANTVEGNKIRNLKAGMITPLTCFLKKPTYEEAAEMIRTGKMMRINSCKYECQPISVSMMPSTKSYVGSFDVCKGQEMSFKGTGNYEQNDVSYHQSSSTSRYLWWFSDETDTSGVNLNSIKHKFVSEGQTDVRLQIVDINGCAYDTTFKGIIQPSAIVKLGSDTTICAGSDLALSVNHPGASYLWNTGSTNNSIIVKNKGTYWVQTTLNGCTYRDSMELKVQPCKCMVQMPNSFTPNGDGINDVYKPSLGCSTSAYDLSIYNRYGQLIFKTNDFNTYWNGMLNGKPLPVDTYVYILNVYDSNLKKQKPIQGTITLLR